MKRRAFLKFCFLFLAAPAYAIPFDIGFKESLAASKTVFEQDPYSLSRSYLSARPSDLRRGPWRLEADLQVHYFSGDYLGTSEWQSLTLERLQGSNRINWEASWGAFNNRQLLARAYRFYGAFSADSWELSAGRMRNAMGNTRVFVSILDRFDALPAIAAESLERPGSDTARWRWRPGNLLKIEGAYCWDRDNARYRSYLLAQGLLASGLEGSFLAGELAPMTRGLGASLEWSVLQGELRWEGTFNEIQEEEFSFEIAGLTPVIRSEIVQKKFKRHLIHWERAYAADWLVSLEYLHNGLGAGDASSYDFTRLLRGEDLYMAKDYVGVHLGRTFTPLWSFAVQGYSNINDGSFAWIPELIFLSPGSNLEVKINLQRSFGPGSGEYRRLPRRHQLLAAWHF
ncbi:MAG: hypothetical protein HY547_00310 [Elusimicrobia bacterium]|nr:hypothetical protein [Elusimicrobiota bacterium]